MEGTKTIAASYKQQNLYFKAELILSQSVKDWVRIKFIKFFHWEYWPMWLVYFPVSFYYIYLSVKAKSFFFFSASNPSIETGGMFFESKWSIFKLIPKEYFPTTILVNTGDDINQISKKLKAFSIDFPFIAKPDRGERGWCVKKIHSTSELVQYRNRIKVPFLIQAYVDYPIELSIFYYRNPDSKKGHVTSVTLKKLLTITGNGFSTVKELIKQTDRAFLQYEKLKDDKVLDFNLVLEKNKDLILVPYGNHVRGALFINYNDIIDEELQNVIDSISKRIDGFYFGRFDLRCTSIEDLKKGENISILELNGAGAEPAHIYDPGFSFFKAQFVIAKHYKMMYLAAMENNKNGIDYMTYQSFKQTRKLEKEYKQKIN